MKHLVKILSLGAALASAPLAHATLISIGLQASGVNSGNISTVATDSGVGTMSYSGSYGIFTVNQITATGAPILTPGTLATTSVQASSSAAGTLTIYITEQGLTSPTGSTNFLSSFTSNLFNGNVISVVESSYYDSANALWGGTQLATTTFTGLSTSSSTTNVNLAGTYSETVKYVVTVGAAGATVNDTINVSAASAATPEPSSLVMLGTGLMSAAGMLVRRRRIS